MVLLCVQLGLCSRCVVKVSAEFTIWLKYVRLSYAQDSYVIGTLRFLQRVSIACYAKRCISYDIDSVRLSDRPSDRLTVQTVRLSVTRWYRGKTTPAKIMRTSLEDSPMTPVSSRLTSTRNSMENMGSDGAEWQRGMKNRQFLATKSPYLRNGAIGLFGQHCVSLNSWNLEALQ